MKEDTEQTAELAIRIVGSDSAPVTSSAGIPLILFEQLPELMTDLAAGTVRMSAEVRKQAKIILADGSVVSRLLMPLALWSTLAGQGLAEDIERLSRGSVPLDITRRAAVEKLQRDLEKMEMKMFEVTLSDQHGRTVAHSGAITERTLHRDIRDVFEENEAQLVGVVTSVGGTTEPTIHLLDSVSGRQIVIRAEKADVAEKPYLYTRQRLLVRYRRNLRTGQVSDYRLVRVLPKFDRSSWEERLRAAVSEGTRVWAGVDHTEWLEEMRNA